MTRYSKFNIIYQLQKWMDSVAGQTFLNYAYSWGAAVVILGTLFKLTHLPGANFFLFLGMGTEVFVFFISAFDRPFDKTADGMVLAHSNNGREEENTTDSDSINPVQNDDELLLKRQLLMEAYDVQLTKINAYNDSMAAFTEQTESMAESMRGVSRISTAIKKAVLDELATPISK